MHSIKRLIGYSKDLEIENKTTDSSFLFSASFYGQIHISQIKKDLVERVLTLATSELLVISLTQLEP